MQDPLPYLLTRVNRSHTDTEGSLARGAEASCWSGRGGGCGDHACQNRRSKTQGSSQALTARKALGQVTGGRSDVAVTMLIDHEHALPVGGRARLFQQPMQATLLDVPFLPDGFQSLARKMRA
jgi:hypothetical protein